jgi:hypothetical protein
LIDRHTLFVDVFALSVSNKKKPLVAGFLAANPKPLYPGEFVRALIARFANFHLARRT